MSADTTPTRVITIGIGGATSSGKTILAKHLRNCLYNSFIIHQDDFVPPAETLPVDPDYGFPNWDDPSGAIDWDRMASFLSDLKSTGDLPPNHQSYDNFNETTAVPIDDNKIIPEWKIKSEKFALQHLEKYSEKLVWVLIDGFLLYWDERIVSNLDVRVFIRVPEDIARARREGRIYHTPERDIWRDPPQYWEKVVWPAYIQAHQHMFEGRDVTKGQVNGKVEELVLFESTQVGMTGMVNTIMEKVLNVPAGVAR